MFSRHTILNMHLFIIILIQYDEMHATMVISPPFTDVDAETYKGHYLPKVIQVTNSGARTQSKAHRIQSALHLSLDCPCEIAADFPSWLPPISRDPEAPHALTFFVEPLILKCTN